MVTYEITDSEYHTTTTAGYRFTSYKDSEGSTVYTIEHSSDVASGFWDDLNAQGEPITTLDELTDYAAELAQNFGDGASEREALEQLATEDPEGNFPISDDYWN